MARNAFALRTSEQSSPDEEFTQNFAADALQVLPDDVLRPGALVLRSAPGGGKTSLLRMFTPGPLLQAIRHRSRTPFDDIFAQLEEIGAVTRVAPTVLGVYISSNGGYSEIGPSINPDIAPGLFRALLNARIVLRSLRAVAALAEVDYDSEAGLAEIRVASSVEHLDAGQVPRSESAVELKAWAEQTEAECLRHLDTVLLGSSAPSLPLHVSIDAMRWLASARFQIAGKDLPYRPLLMFDDVQRLRPWQREVLFSETIEHRTSLMVWIAEQTKVLDSQDLLSASRTDRDHVVIQLEKEWSDRAKKFQQFAMAIADRRLRQTGEELQIATSLSGDLSDQRLQSEFAKAVDALRMEISVWQGKTHRYDQWAKAIEEADTVDEFQRAVGYAKVRILIARDRNKRQQSFDLDPLPDSDLSASGVSQAAERFVTREFGIPYYYGIERIARLASNNIEEFLQLCAALYDLIHAVRVLRNKRSSAVSAADQEIVIRKLAERRFQELSRSVRHGEMAQKLVEAVGTMSRERTYEPNAPYAPGVTGFAINPEDRITLSKASGSGTGAVYSELASVLTSCVAQNVFDMREVRHDNRQFTVFYLNRTLCAHFELVYHQGGWQRVSLRRLVEWCQGTVRRADGRLALN